MNVLAGGSFCSAIGSKLAGWLADVSLAAIMATLAQQGALVGLTGEPSRRPIAIPAG
jgi:hypothetical protein